MLEGVDGRSALGRRFRDLCIGLANDLGGPDHINEPQRALIKQAAAVTVESEKLQAAIIRGETVNHEDLVRVTNVHARLIRQLNIKPRAVKPTASLRDLINRTAA